MTRYEMNPRTDTLLYGDPQILAQWTAALRSGEYEQGRRGYLCQVTAAGKRWCCLGVLCDLAAKAGVSVPREGPGMIEFDGHRASLPGQVRVWAGLSHDNPKVAGKSLVSWNDGEPGNQVTASFAGIADLIEGKAGA